MSDSHCSQGCELRFFTKTNTPEHSDSDSARSQNYYTELTYDAEVNSQVFEIPLHWHKVGGLRVFNVIFRTAFPVLQHQECILPA